MRDPNLVEAFDLSDVAALGRVRDRVRGDPFDVHFASFRIDLNPARNRIAEGLGFGHAVLRKNVHRGTEGLPTIVRGRHVDLAGGKIVVRSG